MKTYQEVLADISTETIEELGAWVRENNSKISLEYIDYIVNEGCMLGMHCNSVYNIIPWPNDDNCKWLHEIIETYWNGEPVWACRDIFVTLPDLYKKSDGMYLFIYSIALWICIKLHPAKDDYNKFLHNIVREGFMGNDKALRELLSITWKEKNVSPSETYNSGNTSEEIVSLRARIAELEEELSKLRSDKEIVLGDISCGPYIIANNKKSAFMSVIWALKELKFFVKRENGNYATNRKDVIQQLIEGTCNADQLLKKAVKTDNTFMKIFHDLQDKAVELWQKG